MQQPQNVVDAIIDLIKGKVMDSVLNSSDAIGGTVALWLPLNFKANY